MQHFLVVHVQYTTELSKFVFPLYTVLTNLKSECV